MKFRMTNQAQDWESVFMARTPNELLVGCRLGWSIYDGEVLVTARPSQKWVEDQLNADHEWFSNKTLYKTEIQIEKMRPAFESRISNTKMGFRYGIKQITILHVDQELILQVAAPGIGIQESNLIKWMNPTPNAKDSLGNVCCPRITQDMNIITAPQFRTWERLFERANRLCIFARSGQKNRTQPGHSNPNRSLERAV